MFDCSVCGVEHPDEDYGKTGDKYRICKCCAYGLISRADRRAARREEKCITKCWRLR